MAETNLAFSKVVATPTPVAWSQAYSAGRLFAAFSLESKTPTESDDFLSKIGKELISTLESEFFTLENKDLESIKQALLTTTARVTENITASIIVCYLNENVLYLFATGGAKAILKRGEKIGTVLEGEESSVNVKSASGYVQDGDIIVLQTKPFLRIIPSSTLASSLDRKTPDEVVEDLAPHIHDKTEGGAAAVVLTYKEGVFEDVPVASTISTTEEEEKTEASDEIIEPITQTPEEDTSTPGPEVSPSQPIDSLEAAEPETKQDEQISDIKPFTSPYQNPAPQSSPYDMPEENSPFVTDRMPAKKRKIPLSFNLSFLNKLKTLPKKTKIILIAGIIILIVILFALLFIVRGSGSGNSNFSEIYNSAQEKYDEGLNLKDLNASLANENFNDAKSILEANRDTFNEGSEEDQKIEELLSKINSELGAGGDTETTTAKEVNKSESKLLSTVIDNSDSDFFTQNEDFIYFINSKGVTRIDKGNDEEEEIIKSSWKDEGGIGLFGSNVYVLDKSDGILKFASSGDEYSETNYFSGDAPDLKESVDMAIDGSVYVLNSDGSIDKYTRGASDDFSISGLDKELSSPTKIFTGEDLDNLYVLDNGNKRIVVLDKSGKFIDSYSLGNLNATEMDIDEANGKILVLASNKVYQLDIK